MNNGIFSVVTELSVGQELLKFKMTIRSWTSKIVVNSGNKKQNVDENLKPKFSKCSKLKRAISHKLLRKTSNKQIPRKKNNKSSVLLLSMITTGEKNIVKMEKRNSCNSENENFQQFLLQPLDVVIAEAKHQLLLEKLSDKNFNSEKYSDYISKSSDSEDEDIYEDMEILQTYFENIYTGDYLEMGLV